MNRTGTTQKRIEQVDGRTVLFLTVCSCLVSFLTTDLIGHAVFTFWLLLILCYFGLYKQGIGCYTVYLVTVVGLYLETKYSISFPSPLLLSMIYKLLLPAMPAYLLFRIPSGKLTASLRKLPIPAKAMLVLVVMLRFEKLIQNKTVIMIAHRLSTIRNADQILVMEHGQLIEQGTHDTLMERQGKYTQMWNSYMESISWKIRAGKGGAIE